jgi:hypothetical protein
MQQDDSPSRVLTGRDGAQRPSYSSQASTRPSCPQHTVCCERISSSPTLAQSPTPHTPPRSPSLSRSSPSPFSELGCRRVRGNTTLPCLFGVQREIITNPTELFPLLTLQTAQRFLQSFFCFCFVHIYL